MAKKAAPGVGFRPLFDRLIVKPLPAETVTPGGIVLPDGTREVSLRGEVVAAGPGRYVDAQDDVVPLSVRVGDIVVYSNLDGAELKRNGEVYTVLSERDVLAVED